MLRTSNIDKKLIHNFLRNVDITGRSGLAAANGGIAFTFFANFFFSLRCTIHIYIDSKPLATLKIQQSTISYAGLLGRGHQELLDGRLCRLDSEQRHLVSNFTTVAIVKLCCHKLQNFDFFVSTISYRPTDLSLLKEFSKNVRF